MCSNILANDVGFWCNISFSAIRRHKSSQVIQLKVNHNIFLEQFLIQKNDIGIGKTIFIRNSRYLSIILPADFEDGEKPQGGDTWKSKFYLLMGGQRKGLEGRQEPSKTLFIQQQKHLFIQQRIQFLNPRPDN